MTSLSDRLGEIGDREVPDDISTEDVMNELVLQLTEPKPIALPNGVVIGTVPADVVISEDQSNLLENIELSHPVSEEVIKTLMTYSISLKDLGSVGLCQTRGCIVCGLFKKEEVDDD